MSLIKCKVCGAQFRSEEGRCPVCRNMPEDIEAQAVTIAAKPAKRKIRITAKAVMAVISVAVAAAVLAPVGVGAFRYYTSPQMYINRGNYEKAYEKADRTERKQLLAEMLSAGKYGKAYDSVKKSEREDIYLESQIANYAKSAYGLLSDETNGKDNIDSGTYYLTNAWQCDNGKYDMYTIELTVRSNDSDGTGYDFGGEYQYYFFFAENGEKCEYKLATSEYDLEDELGISLGGYSYSDYDDYYNDDDYGYDSYSALASDYNGARLGRVDSEITARVDDMISAKMYDDAEYLGRDKKP